MDSSDFPVHYIFSLWLLFTGEGICGEVLPLSLAELMELAPRIGPRRVLQKRVPELLENLVKIYMDVSTYRF